MVKPSKLIVVFKGKNAFEMMNFHNLLNEAKITSYKVNCNTSYSYGIEEIELKVNEKDAERALAIIKQVTDN